VPKVLRPPHDGFFRSAFADSRVVAAEVQAMLPRHLFEALDLSRIEAMAARFPEAGLATPESDGVFQVPTRSQDTRVFVMLEHQRRSSWDMPFRVLRYVTGFWTAQLTRDPRRRTLPAVVPLIVSNVAGGWRGPWNLQSMLEGDAELMQHLAPYMPRLELVVDDLSRLDAAGILRRDGPPIAHLAWWLLGVATDLTRLERESALMRKTARAVREASPAQYQQAMTYLRRLPMTTAQKRQVVPVFEVMSMEEYRKRVPYLQDIVWRQEARKRGLREGRKRGIEEGRELGKSLGREEGRQEGRQEALREALLQMWEATLGKPPGKTAKGRIAKADEATLRQWLLNARTAKRPADILR
jgi:predicted transposase YdaD